MSETADKAMLIPAIHYPEDLPVAARREDIAQAITDNQVVIVAGETGSGKTTQLPKICLQLGRGQASMIGHTQPRRLAARTVAKRIADELGVALGDQVGYEVRFNDRVSDETAIKLMTDGILLMEIQRDRLLKKYDTIIIDEAHERSLNIDFLLGYLKRLLPKRPDLKLIITSATIDLERFSRHFNNAPVIEVSGRSHPVETHYVGGAESEDDDLNSRIANLVGEIDAGVHGERGDVLVFLPGEREIRELARVLRGATTMEILPLYARLSHAEQNKVFEGRRGSHCRVVLATNVAETSLTVPGIRYVIDPGTARISRYNPRTKLQRLPVEAISRASADQRRGRCGRVGPGVCFRLYEEEDYSSRSEFTDPEIQRTHLAAVVLRMLSLNLGEVEHFPFINPPDTRAVRDGYRLLRELCAVEASGKLTRLGKQVGRLPVDPRLGRMVLAGAKDGCLAEILVIASALAVQDPRERPPGKQAQADQSHARFRHPRSDFMALLALWRYYEGERQALSQNQLRKLCKKEYLSFLKMREWRDIHTQLTIGIRRLGFRPGSLSPQAGMTENSPNNKVTEDQNSDSSGSRNKPSVDENSYQAIHRALLSGLLDNIAQHQEGRDYLGARNRKMQIFPGSYQSKKTPKWLVAAEIVETSKVFARQVAGIDPRWALDANPDLLKRHYYTPRWNKRRGQVTAYERITLFGLTLADKQVVHYGPLAPAESRELLIREALVAGNYQRPPAFLRHNLKKVDEIQALEARVRRRDLLVDEEALYRFYDERLPEHIFTANRLQAWIKKEVEAASGLRLNREQLLLRDPGETLEAQFPDALEWQDTQFKLSYQFEPGKEADGVSVTVPLGLLNRVPRHLFSWLVPGLLREKCIQLVKSLPKDKRKRLVPVPDNVDKVLAQITAENRQLTDCLAENLSMHTGIRLTSADWNGVTLDDYYRMNIRVVDARGELLGQGRDLDALITRFREDAREVVSNIDVGSPARSGITRWDFAALEQQWSHRQAGTDIICYPALVDKGDSVSIELFDYPEEATLAHRLGVLRLLRLQGAQQVRYLRKNMLRGNEWTLVLAGAGLARETLLDDVVDGAYVHAMNLLDELPYNEEHFRRLVKEGSGAVVGCANDIEKALYTVAQQLVDIRHWLSGVSDTRPPDLLQDVQAQLKALVAPHFVRDTPPSWFAQYPRYFKALKLRLERFRGQESKDGKYVDMLESLSTPLWLTVEARPGVLRLSPLVREYRWLLEEFRVSLFAQNLGTRQAVSEKRLRARWGEVQGWLDANPH